MTKRENLLWQIILVIVCIAIIYNCFLLYQLNSNSNLLWGNYNNEEIGTDKLLQQKVQKLEMSLQYKKDFLFKMKKNPSDLSAVIDIEGIESMGKYRHFRLHSTYKGNENKWKAIIVVANDTKHIVGKNDSIAGGMILDVKMDGLIFEIDNEKFNYKIGENND